MFNDEERNDFNYSFETKRMRGTVRGIDYGIDLEKLNKGCHKDWGDSVVFEIFDKYDLSKSVYIHILINGKGDMICDVTDYT